MLGDQETSICQLETDGVDKSLIWKNTSAI
jgi:hypothetical protein